MSKVRNFKKIINVNVKLRYIKIDNYVYYNFYIENGNMKLFQTINRLIKNMLECKYGDTIDGVIGINTRTFAEIEFKYSNKIKFKRIYGILVTPDRNGYVEYNGVRYKLELIDESNIKELPIYTMEKILM